MNLTPPMDPNAAPLDTVRTSRLPLVGLGFVVFLFLWLALTNLKPGPLQIVLFAIPLVTVVYKGIDAVYQKLKAYESTNEEFLRGR